MSTAIATRAASPGRPQWMLQLTCSRPSTPSPRLIRSRVSMGDLQRAPARCSIRPVHRPKMQVAACSCGDASHGLFVTSPCRSGKPPRHAVRGFRRRTRPVELPVAPDPGYTAQPRAHGSTFQLSLNPSSWARAVPVSSLRLPAPEGPLGGATRVVIAVLMPFHSITTTDSVKRISGGLAKSPSEVLNPPSSSPIHAVLRQ